ncbi:MAG TPA: winged helix-turn-helix domain-containing protein [Thermoanaerobaculia bacterium]|nr:winged helix-turn-helix domain-containing protein [Thermoanaerobaculia bacterium]
MTRGVLEFGDYRFDRGNQILMRAGEELPLPPRALGVLSRLLEEPGQIVSKQTLLDSVWNGAYVTETSLSEAVGLLRETLQDAPQAPVYIQTVHRRGYRFIAPVRVPDVAAGFSPPEEGDGLKPVTTLQPAAPLALATAVLLVLLAAAFVMATYEPQAAPRPLVVRFGVAPPPPYEVLAQVPSLAVSADGRHFVYTARRGDESALFHREVSAVESREIAGTRGGLLPFFSPDGRRVGFFLDGQLVSVPLAGGTALPLARVAGTFWGAGWSEDDTLVFAAGFPAALHRARPGGAVEPLTDPTGQGISHLWPRILPGGKAVIFTVWTNTPWDARVDWRSLVTGEQRTLLKGVSDCSFARGLLVCAQAGGTIVTAPFDPLAGRVTGPPLPLLRDAAIQPTTGFAQLAVGGGTLVYLTGPREDVPRTLQRLVSGTPRPIAAQPRVYCNFMEGPRGEVAVTIRDRGRSDIWVLDAADGTPSRLTFERFNVNPVWSPDGRWVAFASREENGPFNVYRRRADGSGAVERMVKSPLDLAPLAWSPDGREMMLREARPGMGFGVRLLDVATGTLRPWQRAHPKTLDGVWSPDGKWIAYTSGETGRWEIYVRSYPGGEGRWQVSTDGGENPSWSADGRTIYFQRRPRLEHASELWSVPVDPHGDELSPGAATRVFANRSMLVGAAGPGGVMLLANGPLPPDPAEVRVVLEWPSLR